MFVLWLRMWRELFKTCPLIFLALAHILIVLAFRNLFLIMLMLIYLWICLFFNDIQMLWIHCSFPFLQSLENNSLSLSKDCHSYVGFGNSCQPKLDIDVAKRFLRGVIQQANEDNMKLNNGIRSLKNCCYNEFLIFWNI